MACPSCALAKAGFLPISSWFIFGVCLLFALGALATIYIASRSGQIKTIEEAKWTMLEAESAGDWLQYERPQDYRNVEGFAEYWRTPSENN